MYQTKTIKVEINQQRNNLAILEMPKDYRKGQSAIKKNEISIEKIECIQPKKKEGEQNVQRDFYQQKKKFILKIKDEREKQPFQSQKFIDDLPPAQSFMLYKNKDKYTLHFISQKSEVYKYITEEWQNKIFKDIDRGLDARKNQENRDKVNISNKKQVVQTVPDYEENVSSSDSEDSQPSKKKKNQKHKKNKLAYKLNESDDEKPKKKVKLNDSSEDENSSEDYLDSYDS